jgi:hypothetical protein
LEKGIAYRKNSIGIKKNIDGLHHGLFGFGTNKRRKRKKKEYKLKRK